MKCKCEAEATEQCTNCKQYWCHECAYEVNPYELGHCDCEIPPTIKPIKKKVKK